MPTLSDKLKNLGVKVGIPKDQVPERPTKPTKRLTSLEEVLGGRWVNTRQGDAFVVEYSFPNDQQHGIYPVLMENPMSVIAEVVKDPRVAELKYSEIAFMDTETSGLSGGTGTYAFMIGLGRYLGDAFKLSIFFMQDPSEEPAMLEAVADYLAPCKAFVSFNGKSFDAPLLRTRYMLNDIPLPFGDFAHIDLLHIARRLWRDRLPSRALKYLEEKIMFVPRTSEEVPGFEIPWLYFDYLRTGDILPLKGVFYHNSMDVVSMAVLFNLVNWVLEEPNGKGLEHGQDIIALAKVFEDLKKWDDAAILYERGLASTLPESDFHQAVRRLSILQKKRGDFDEAVRLWHSAAEQGHIYAHIELAKFYEHRVKEKDKALDWTQKCKQQLEAADMPPYEKEFWLAEVEKRLLRLNK